MKALLLNCLCVLSLISVTNLIYAADQGNAARYEVEIKTADGRTMKAYISDRYLRRIEGVI